jgi:hypothetical protein
VIVQRSCLGLKLGVACGCESGPGSCQEAREQAGGPVWKRARSKPSVESPMGEANQRSVAVAKPAASLDIEEEPSQAVHGEGHGSGEEPGSAAAKDSSARNVETVAAGTGEALPGRSVLRVARTGSSYNRCGAGKWIGCWEGVGGGRNTDRAVRTTQPPVGEGPLLCGTSTPALCTCRRNCIQALHARGCSCITAPVGKSAHTGRRGRAALSS